MLTLILSSTQIIEEFGISWPLFLAQIINFLIVILLFILATRSILARGKGTEVPIWIFLSLIIPIVLPIIALIHFRKNKVAQ